MASQNIGKFLIIFFLAGILGGIVFGLVLSIIVLSLIHSLLICIVFAVFVSVFYIWSIFKQARKRRWFVVIRRFFEIFFLATMLAGMFSLEEEIIPLNSSDWTIIYICVGSVTIIFTAFVVVGEYFSDSLIYKEGKHIINGMIRSGLLPEFDDTKE